MVGGVGVRWIVVLAVEGVYDWLVGDEARWEAEVRRVGGEEEATRPVVGTIACCSSSFGAGRRYHYTGCRCN